jgi:hypothetical protein
LTVQYSVCPPVPELSHFTEETPKVSTGIAGEETWDILEEEAARSVSFHKVKKSEGEDASVSVKADLLSGDTQVLAREASRP